MRRCHRIFLQIFYEILPVLRTILLSSLLNQLVHFLAVDLDAIGLTEGAIAFFAGHLIATWLFLRNRRQTLTLSQRLLGLLIVPTVVLIAWRLPADRGDASGIALYALALSIMAATAWTSRFPRYRTGIGAILFVVSDLLIFARMGPLAGSAIPDILVWPTYFIGQALVAVGVIATLAAEQQNLPGQ